MFDRSFILLSTALFCLSTVSSLGDVLYLQDGRKVEGTFLGGDARTVRFVGQDGQVRTYSVAQIRSIAFGSEASAPVTRPAAARQSSPASLVPQGATLVVRMIDSVDSNKHKPGDTFRATVEEDVTVDDRVLIVKGAPARVQLVHVKQSGQLRGEEEIALQLRSVEIGKNSYSVNSRFAEIASEGKGEQTAKVVGGGAAVGAVIGAIAGGKKGAAIGAATGAGAGAAVQMARGKQVKIPSEALLSFTLEEPLKLR